MAAMFLIAAIIGFAESLFLRWQIDGVQAEAVAAWQTRLEEQAAERASDVAAWVAHGTGDVQVLSAFPTVRSLAEQRAARPSAGVTADPETRREHALEVLSTFVEVHRYRGAFVFDASGRLLGGTGDPPSTGVIAGVLANRGGRVFCDIRDFGGVSTMLFAAPIGYPTAPSNPTGYVVLLVDAREAVYSQLLHTPRPSETGETLLVGVDGRRPVYLSPTRHLVGPIPVHGFPTASDWTASEGVLRHPGTFDYRGKPVVIATAPVASTDWRVALKIDRDEAAVFFQGASFRGGSFLTALLIGQVVIVVALLRRRQILHLRQQRETAEQLRFLNALYRTLLEADEIMVRERDPQRLLDETCRVVVQSAGFLMAWIGELGPDGRVTPVASAGEVRGYLDEIEITTDPLKPTGQGPAGTSVREQRTVVIHDVASAHTMAPWRLAALERGFRAVAAVPLVSRDRLFGVLLVYAGEPRLLRGDAVPLIEKLAANLSYSLDVLNLEARHRETTLALSASEEQLRQAQKMEAIGRLAGGIAHDFNNILMVITGYADVALSPKLDDERRRRSIAEILTAAERATDLTRQLVAFSRKQVMQPKVLDLNALVLRSESLLKRLMPDDVRIVVEAAPGLRRVRADPSKLEQVLLNLIVNARDAMPNGGRIFVETDNVTLNEPLAVAAAELPPGEYVALSVSDSGEGMPAEVLEHLFEPFFTTKETGKGAGLGLSLVYGIVRQSGGGVAVESVVALGSTFRVLLPALQQSEAEPEPVPPVAAPNRGHELVMVVEDNEAVRQFVTEALQDSGYRVTSCDGPGAALTRLTFDLLGFDLLLTDLVMPEMDGYELARQACAARPSLRVLYMTGYSDNPKLQQDALSTGIDLLEKPFTAATLTGKVREVLDRSMTADEPR